MEGLAQYVIDRRDFRIERKVGSGAYASVSLAVDEKNERKVAIKKMKKEVEKHMSQVMFIREITILLSIKHPTILTLHGFSIPSDNRDCYYIVTEWMSNGTLKALEEAELDKTHSQRYNATTKTKILFGVAVGMRHCHSKNVLHRDIKAENIFIDDNYEPRIADFGLAKVSEKTMEMSGQMGTPFYMAPEIFDANPKGSYSVDVYAFGILLLSVFNHGKFKFSNKPILGIPQLVGTLLTGQRYEIPSTTPPAYRSLIEKCWAGEPKARPSFSQIVEIMNSPEFLIPGADPDAVAEYRDRILNWREETEQQRTPPADITLSYKWD